MDFQHRRQKVRGKGSLPRSKSAGVLYFLRPYKKKKKKGRRGELGAQQREKRRGSGVRGSENQG